MLRAVTLLALLSSITGCGLVLDASPPRARDAGIDAPGLDAPGPDAAGLDAPGLDAGADPCRGVSDGVECSEDPRRICLGELCVFSACGDGFIDEEADEDCEPAADPACHPLSCRHECEASDDCATDTPCLFGSCSGHVCTYEITNAGCTLESGDSGVCVAGACVAAGCGNGIVEMGEECDRGEAGLPGCIACQYECSGDGSCDDGDACNGVESCEAIAEGANVVGQACAAGTVIHACVDRACFTGACVTVEGEPTCEYELVEDDDGDGFADDADCGDVGGDCDDRDADVHPGAVEVCNMRDDDCDGVPDEETGAVEWCPDHDGDGFGDPSGRIEECVPPGPPYVRDCTDCFDTIDPMRADLARRVHPGVTEFSATPYCTERGTCSFDYDCDGMDEQQIGRTATCRGLVRLMCNSTAGWVERVPPCGEAGTFVTCHGVGPFLCEGDETDRRQGCR